MGHCGNESSIFGGIRRVITDSPAWCLGRWFGYNDCA
ncbi:uncharacterized protein G2W53_018204 [Senna tora]|uniref:Uncharacterized protein n=1 Tax=Senna tora TaxID=362788 RepID=A0A834TRF7_9FABA|nr:uncharacterized protein G2W53_018204 [Senna tora]